MAYQRRLGDDPLWTRELGSFPALRQIAHGARRRGSDLLDSLTLRTSRLLEVAESGAIRTVARLKSLTNRTELLRRPRLPARSATNRTSQDVVATAAVPRSRNWPFVVSEKFLTISIAVASVVLAVMAVRTLSAISSQFIDFVATTVNGFLTKMGFPPAM